MGAPGDQPFPWLAVGVVVFFVLIIGFAVGLGLCYVPF